MRAWVPFAVLAALAGTAWLLSSSPSDPWSIKPGDRVLVVGDSHAEGMSRYLTQAGWRVEARRGWSFASWLPLIESVLLTHRPSVVVLVLGTNDGAQLDPSKEADAVRRVLSACGQSARVVWASPPDVRVAHMDEVRAMVPEQARAAGVPLRIIDGRTLGLVTGADGVHLSMDGYKAWTDAIVASLKGARSGT